MRPVASGERSPHNRRRTLSVDAALLARLWDFADPAGSEARFRAAARKASGPLAEVLMTQVARALGLQDQFEAGHAVLDSITPATPEVEVRVALERGRLLRSGGSAAEAAPWFDSAAEKAEAAGLEALQVDALHMAALVAPEEEQLAANEKALAVARASTDVTARDWDASVLNNLGMVHADSARWSEGLRLKAEHDAAGTSDPYVEEELALLG